MFETRATPPPITQHRGRRAPGSRSPPTARPVRPAPRRPVAGARRRPPRSPRSWPRVRHRAAAGRCGRLGVAGGDRPWTGPSTRTLNGDRVGPQDQSACSAPTTLSRACRSNAAACTGSGSLSDRPAASDRGGFLLARGRLDVGGLGLARLATMMRAVARWPRERISAAARKPSAAVRCGRHRLPLGAHPLDGRGQAWRIRQAEPLDADLHALAHAVDRERPGAWTCSPQRGPRTPRCCTRRWASVFDRGQQGRSCWR